MSGQYHGGLLSLKKCAKKFVFESQYRSNTSAENDLNTDELANDTNSRAQTPIILASPGECVGFLSTIVRADHNPERLIREIEESNFDQQLDRELEYTKLKCFN